MPMSVRGKPCAISSLKFSELFFNAGITQCADDFGTAVNHIASLQELTAGSTNSVRRTGEDDVTRLKSANTREIRNQEWDVENEISRASFLHALARDITPDTDVIGVAE
jgi:hypothetical protein